MHMISTTSVHRRLCALFTASLCLTGLLVAQDSRNRTVRNDWEIHNEIRISPEAQAAVQEHFLSFLEYQDLVMFHPKVGYYSSGRVSFDDDYQTFPIVLAPVFGHMVAEQIFNMWDGMRRAGTLAATDRFTIAEFGPGDGVLAESILDYIESKSKANDARWRQFADQVLYVCYDRSPALNNIQRERNKRFGGRFDARVADATNPTATIPEGSLKGVILSNELPDAFSVHKVILSPDGKAEVGFVVPSLSTRSWQDLRRLVPAAVATVVETENATVTQKFFQGRNDPPVYLTRSSFVALLESLVTSKEYESAVYELSFQETYVPASAIPELAAHLSRYAPVYASVLATNSRGLVTYINLGAENFIQGSSRVLQAGYVLTIDYGTNWDGILAEDSVRLRTYGPARREANRIAQEIDPNATANDRDASDPYDGPTLNDMTTDVNFSLLAAQGDLVGLTPLYYGSQRALQTGTTISLNTVPENSKWADKFLSWASDFGVPSVYKVLVQQKVGTDAEYRFPDLQPESLAVDSSGLTDAQRQRAAEIDKQLRGQ